MKSEKFIRLVVEKALELCDFTDNYQLADLVGVAKSSLSGAIKRGNLTRRYYDAIEAKCGVSKADLFAMVEKEYPAVAQAALHGGTISTAGDKGANFAFKGDPNINQHSPNLVLSEKEERLIWYCQKYGEFLLDKLLEKAEEHQAKLDKIFPGK